MSLYSIVVLKIDDNFQLLSSINNIYVQYVPVDERLRTPRYSFRYNPSMVGKGLSSTVSKELSPMDGKELSSFSLTNSLEVFRKGEKQWWLEGSSTVI